MLTAAHVIAIALLVVAAWRAWAASVQRHSWGWGLVAAALTAIFVRRGLGYAADAGWIHGEWKAAEAALLVLISLWLAAGIWVMSSEPGR
jgi:hypothetical protein